MLFLNHSPEQCMTYSDDGEMHCSTCDIDFRRDSAESIENRIQELSLSRFIKAQRDMTKEEELTLDNALKSSTKLVSKGQLQIQD
jgi:hypothetical protein